MKQIEYNIVLSCVRDHFKCPLALESVLENLKERFVPRWSYDALLSICLFHFQQRTKVKYPEQSTKEKCKEYYRMYNAKKCQQQTIGKSRSTTLLDMATDLDISPALLARLIVKEYLSQHDETNAVDGGDAVAAVHIKTEQSLHLRNPFLIQDEVLSSDVRQCVLHDIGYGPVTDAIKHMVGVEYENKLLDHVRKLNIPFQDETELRKLGYDKTPDIKLEIPICIKGQVVCWIESKASFGCPEAHKTYLNEQYYSYWNRFGPGLVIYWYGFVDELADEMLKSEMILMDHFPDDSEIVHFQPKSVKTSGGV